MPNRPNWKQIWIPDDLAKELKPMAEQNNLTISDVVTLLAIEGGVSLRARADFEQAKALGAEAVCPVCHKHELSRAPGIDDEPKDS